ncbi:MAG TPA: hypothetical protein VHO70_17610 [Chitinispirillaceae bacterium]|nr:hypothetical protein [Chitinispirillaceae bacterium]
MSVFFKAAKITLLVTQVLWGQRVSRAWNDRVWIWNDDFYCSRNGYSFQVVNGDDSTQLLKIDSTFTISTICAFDSGIQVNVTKDNFHLHYIVNCFDKKIHKIKRDSLKWIFKCGKVNFEIQKYQDEKLLFGYADYINFNKERIDSGGRICSFMTTNDCKYGVWGYDNQIGFYDIHNNDKCIIDDARACAAIAYLHDTLYFYRATANRKEWILEAYNLKEKKRVCSNSLKYKKVPYFFHETKSLHEKIDR